VLRAGRYLDADELSAFVAPPPSWVHAVMEWLRLEGVTTCSLSRNQDYVIAQVQTDKAEALLACKFRRFRHRFVRVVF